MDCKLDFDKENDDDNVIEAKIVNTIKERAKTNHLINGNVNCKLHIFNLHNSD